MTHPPPRPFPLEKALARVWLPADMKRERGTTHALVVEQVANVGEAAGYRVIREWPTFFQGSARAYRVDLAFFSDFILRHVVEVDSSPRRKSVEKLRRFGPWVAKWWVFYGKQRPSVPPDVHVVMVRRVDRRELEGRGSRERGATSSPFQNGRPENSRTAGSSRRTRPAYKKGHAAPSSGTASSRSEGRGRFR